LRCSWQREQHMLLMPSMFATSVFKPESYSRETKLVLVSLRLQINTCDGLDGSNAQVCLDWVESRWRVMRVLGGQLLTPVRARRLSMTTLLRPVHRDVFSGRFDIECSCE